eukprot:jgi/Botrbrau1/4065/Bobra.152_3s0021.1
MVAKSRLVLPEAEWGPTCSDSLLVKALPANTRREDLLAAFGSFGCISDVNLPRDYHTGQFRGFAFIKFADRRDAERALYEHDAWRFFGVQVQVILATRGRKTPEEMALREGRVSGGPGYYDPVELPLPCPRARSQTTSPTRYDPDCRDLVREAQQHGQPRPLSTSLPHYFRGTSYSLKRHESQSCDRPVLRSPSPNYRGRPRSRSSLTERPPSGPRCGSSERPRVSYPSNGRSGTSRSRSRSTCRYPDTYQYRAPYRYGALSRHTYAGRPQRYVSQTRFSSR